MVWFTCPASSVYFPRPEVAMPYSTVFQQVLAILDQFMAEYQGIFYDTFGQASLKVLSQFPSPEDILTAGIQGLMAFLKLRPGPIFL